MNSIYLFCGGSRNYPNGKSKPLQKYGNSKELLVEHYYHIKRYFDKITFIVESDEISLFRDIISKLKLEVGIIGVKNKTSTLEKAKEIISVMDEEFASFSYPDIFCNKSFWDISKDNDFTITRVSISSRFPRIYSDIFTNVAKGISNYQSEVPANPHYIFGGKFDFKVSQFKKYISEFSTDNKNFEVDFLDNLALKNTIFTKTIFEKWFNIDSNRDYLNMHKIYGENS